METNMRFKASFAAGVVAAVAAPSLALAATMATATTDLNLRAGPGPNYEVIGVVQNNGEVTIDGCIEGSKWCEVTYQGKKGWAYSAYLTAEVSGSRVVIAERATEVGVPVVTYKGSDSAAMGAAGGAVTGALIGGPIGAVVGGVAGAAAGAAIDPPETVRTYVASNRGDVVYLEGEVVVGAAVPETVVLRPVPDYQYSYAYVNGQLVLVEPASRQIVYVLR